MKTNDLKEANRDKGVKSFLRGALCLLCFLLFTCPVIGANNTIIVGTISFTNSTGPSNGATITINSTTLTFTNSVVIPSAQVLTNGSPYGATTNLFNELSDNPANINGLLVSYGANGTNLVLTTLVNGTLSVTVQAVYGSYSAVTTTLTNAYTVRVPITVEQAPNQTNIASLVVSALENSTNASTTGAYYLTNFASLAGNQVVTGNKTFTGANSLTGTIETNTVIFSGGVTNVGLTNCHVAGTLSGGTILATNLIGSGGGSVSGLPAATLTLLADVGSDDIADFYSAAHTPYFHLDYVGNLAINGSFVSTNGGTFLGAVSIAGNLQAGSVSNIVAGGTNVFAQGADLSFGRYPIPTLANGNNAGVVVGTNVFCDLSGPSGAFTINGIAGGRDGKFIILINRAGQTLTIANDSGVEPTAANRIYTSTGANVSAGSSNCSALLIYDANVTHWILLMLQ